MKIGIVFDEAQAKCLVEKKVSLDNVFSFCPEAAYYLKQHGCKVTTNTESYLSLSHAKNVVLTEKYLDAIVGHAAKAYNLNSEHADGLRVYLVYALFICFYVYFSVRHLRASGNIYFYCDGKKIVSSNSLEAAVDRIVFYVTDAFNSYEFIKYGRIHNAIATFYNKIIYKLHASKAKIRILAHKLTLIESLATELQKTADVKLIFTHKICQDIFRTTLFFHKIIRRILKNDPNKPVFYFRTLSPTYYKKVPTNQDKEFLENVLGLNICNQQVTKIIGKIVTEYIPFLKGQYKLGEEMVEFFKPAITSTDHVIYHFIRSSINKSAEYGGIGILVNHGSHTAHPLGLANISSKLWLSAGRGASAFTKYFVVRTPPTLELAKQVYKNLPEIICVPPKIMAQNNNQTDVSELRLVYAGNYSGPDFHIPWCTETSGENLQAMIELVEEAAKMDNIKLVIKLKINKAHVHYLMLSEKIKSLNVESKISIDFKTPFLDLLKNSHALISNLSATIEEALYNKKPIILYSLHKKYFHIPITGKLDSANPDFVYGAANRQDFGRIAEFIRANYSKIIASDKALDAMVWKESELTNIKEFAARILSELPKNI